MPGWDIQGKRQCFAYTTLLMEFQNLRSHHCSDVPTCTYVNSTKRAITQQALLEQTSLIKQTSSLASTSDVLQETGSHPDKVSSSDSLLPGQMFHMVMGFVQGTKYGHKDEDGHLVTSLDGYNSYLVIVDCANRYTWVFLCKTKVPQVTTVTQFPQAAWYQARCHPQDPH